MGVLHEECGVFGICSPERAQLADLTYYALSALQHRGQESAGIALNDDGIITTIRDVGLVSEVFTTDRLKSLGEGNIAVGHVRYSTTGSDSRRNAQPLRINHYKGQLALAHNGNLTNAHILRHELESMGSIFHSTTDTEVIAYIIVQERLRARSIEDAVARAMDRLEGAYSLVLSSPSKLIAARDPHGFRPLCMGAMPNGATVFASESCALDAIGAEFIRDLLPGEIITVGNHGMDVDRSHCGQFPQTLCAFEYIYFARPDSVIDGCSVHTARQRAGRILARVHPAAADVVIGVPDSGLDAAIGYAAESGLPYGIGFVKNKYIGRTFIAPDGRLDKVKIKLSAVESEVKGKSVVLIDDSIVRGTTCARIVNLLRQAGAKEVHMRVSAPPFLNPCYYGTDIDSRENLIACKYSFTEITQLINADSLGYLPLESLPELTGSNEFCSACFDGNYPTEIPTDTRKDRFEQQLSKKKAEDKTTAG